MAEMDRMGKQTREENGMTILDEIAEYRLTNATELEFWVKTPDDRADRNQLSIAQELKEQ